MPSVQLKPKTGAGSDFGLEVWMTGTHAELDVAVDALQALSRGRVHVAPFRTPLEGWDRGRFRLYVHVRGATLNGHDQVSDAPARPGTRPVTPLT
jgi:hypothetical protein